MTQVHELSPTSTVDDFIAYVDDHHLIPKRIRAFISALDLPERVTYQRIIGIWHLPAVQERVEERWEQNLGLSGWPDLNKPRPLVAARDTISEALIPVLSDLEHYVEHNQPIGCLEGLNPGQIHTLAANLWTLQRYTELTLGRPDNFL